MDLTELQNKTWIIQSVNAADNPGVAQADSLQFTSDTSGVTIIRVNTDLSTETTTQSRWAESCSFTPEGDLSGVTVLGQSFLIKSSLIPSDPTKQQLTCQFVDTSAQQRKIKAAGTSAVLGGLIGAVAGFAAGFPWLGALIGFASALTGSSVTTASLDSRYTSSGTWVADDGSTGRIIVGPRYVKAVSA